MPPFVLTIVTICGYVTAIGAAVVLLWKGLGWLMRLVKKIDKFLQDWNGEPERPGVEARPGINERIADISKRLSDVEKEVKHNGGGSIKDVVHSMDEKIDTLQEAFEAHVKSGVN